MFEKEAEEYTKENLCKECHHHCIEGMCTCTECKKKTFKDGADFGYNKANEWHYNGIPHDSKPYLCKVEQPTKFDTSEYEILFFDDKEMSWFRWLTLWSGEEGNECARIDRKVIAWKEIVLPKEDEIESEMFPEIILPKGSSEFIDKVIADAEKRIKEIE